jgi:hypothetical protein
MSDSSAQSWTLKSISGLPETGRNPPATQDLARLPSGGRQTVILAFVAFVPDQRPKPATVAVSMLCWRMKDSTAERMSVGLPEIPVAK